MTWQAWLTLLVVAAILFALARDRVAPPVAVMSGVILLFIAGVITPAQAFAGFSNPAPFTVAALYVLAHAIVKTGVLQPAIPVILGGDGRRRRQLGRLLIPSAAASAFLNNTPLVAMLAPQVAEWSDRQGHSPSRYLMPLCYGIMLGGMLTLIGTSSNVVVSGLMEAAGQAPLGMFELTRVGVPIAVLGLACVILLAPLVLPDRRAARKDLEGLREFTVSMLVVPGGPLDGQAVGAGGLRSLTGVFLVQIDRGTESLAPVDPTAVLKGGDRLTFVGRADLVVDLQGTKGLVSVEAEHLAQFDTVRHTFFEVVIGAVSPLVGRTLKEAEFRGRYQAAVVAIHRAGHRVNEKLGAVKLQVGDTLLLLTDAGFRDRWGDRSDFLLVSRLGGSPPSVTRKAGVAGVVALIVLLLIGTGLLPTLKASLLGAIALVGLRALTPSEARSAVNFDVIMVIAGSFGLAAAIESSGLASTLADGVISALHTLGPRGVLAGVVVATVLANAFITNNATAVLIFPIGMSAAHALQTDPRPFAIAICIAASASFLTPVGYQCNMMVYGPGGYRFGDYARLGAPLTLIVIATTVMLVPVFWPF